MTGLASPSRVITFDEHVFAPGTILTNQYADLGVRFSPNIVYGLPIAQNDPAFLPVSGNLARNFYPNNSFDVFEGLDPFSIEFEEDQQEVAFALNTTAGKVTITALLDGVVVRTFSSEVVDLFGDTLYYGFSGITFDEILIDAPGDKGTIFLDNIQFWPAPRRCRGARLDCPVRHGLAGDSPGRGGRAGSRPASPSPLRCAAPAGRGASRGRTARGSCPADP